MALATAALGFYEQCSTADTRHENENHPVVNELPSIMLTMEDQKRISARDLSGKTILIFYRPECDHCQREATAIRKHLDAFSKYQLYFVGTDGSESAQKFAIDYLLANIDNIHFVQTGVDDILNSVGSIATPSMFIYSDDLKLIKHLDGETPIEEILKYL
jgi:thioredoxin-related protein